MAKRLSEKQKDEIINFFSEGKTIDELSKSYNCTKLTISRNLKKSLDQKKYKELIKKSKVHNSDIEYKEDCSSLLKTNSFNKRTTYKKILNQSSEEDFSQVNPFIEITPLDYEIENSTQKDLSSVPISEIRFPDIVYIIVDKNIELETKFLKDIPEWQFLSKEELERKIIEIYFDLKIAKRFCSKDQKVIKVPNTEVFKIVAPLLLAKGISRLVCSDQLIAL